MNKKLILIITEILFFCLIICVGFSAWSLFKSLDYEFAIPLKGSISSENAMLCDEYISIKAVDPFIFSDLGFFGSDNQWQSSISVTFELTDFEKCREFSASGENIQVELILGLSCADKKGIFGTDSKIDIIARSESKIVSDIKTEKKDTTQRATFTLDISGTESEFTVIFDFDTKDYENYLKLFETFYEDTTSTNAEFTFTISISK